ncbi:hypothetical protein AVEN_124132-1 [Araneus ventricosus]|uniref:Uncharacterized protein n=1 Tax=Araneus ventricosus TaxID=182803 RepID=A0A4Y2I684_ARAVE|nr:hypothetical protein AVEN_124132-1 [Araneus ventricosus]
MRIFDVKRTDVVEKFGNPTSFVFHLAHSVIKLKYDPGEGERCSLTKAKATKWGRLNEALSEKRDRRPVLKAEGWIGSVEIGTEVPVVWFAWSLHECPTYIDGLKIETGWIDALQMGFTLHYDTPLTPEIKISGLQFGWVCVETLLNKKNILQTVLKHRRNTCENDKNNEK